MVERFVLIFTQLGPEIFWPEAKKYKGNKM